MRPICRFDRGPSRVTASRRDTNAKRGTTMVARSPDANGHAVPEMSHVRHRAEDGRKLFVIMRSPDEPLLAQLRLGNRRREDGRRRAEHDLRRERRRWSGRFHRVHVARLSRAEGVPEPTVDRLDFHRAGRHHDQPAVRELIRSYCFDYVTLPLPYEWISHVLGHARGMAALDRVDGAAYAASIGEHGMIGNCEAMQQLFSTIRKVAKTDASVFISGESGTGKELTALAIHERSGRGRAVRRDQLRRDSASPAAVGTVRLRARRVHRREPAARGPDRIGERRHAVSRRNRRHAGRKPGEPAALPAGRQDRAARRAGIDSGRRTDHLGHSRRPRRRGRGRRFRADLYHRLCVLRIHEPRAARISTSSRTTCCRNSSPTAAARSAASRRPRSTRCAAMNGRATCAS